MAHIILRFARFRELRKSVDDGGEVEKRPPVWNWQPWHRTALICILGILSASY